MADKEVSKNIMAAILQKRRMELNRHENRLEYIERERKKVMSYYDQNYFTFLSMTKHKRNEWWKKDKYVRDSLKKRLDIHLKNAEKRSDQDEEDMSQFDVIKSDDHMIILDPPPTTTSLLPPIESKELPVKSILKKTEQEEIKLPSLENDKEEVKIVENKIRSESFMAPELLKRQQSNRASLVRMKNAREEEKELLNTAFNRFYYHTPRYVESKTHLDELKRKKDISDRCISKGRVVSQKKDWRYENLLHDLCGLKELEKDKRRVLY